MGDELDELFGAFDDDDEQRFASPSLSEPKSKKIRFDDVKGEENKPTADQVLNGGDSSKESTVTSSISRSAYSAVMNQPAISHLHKGTQAVPSSGAVKKDPVGQKAAVDSEREIATGIAHDKTVRSYSAYPKNLPPGHTRVKVTPPTEPAKVYPFPLDPFQQQAISYIDKEESVLVAAHTSAGTYHLT